MTEISGPVLRYFGGKYRIRKWIQSFFPPHLCFTESFAGGGSVVLSKEPAKFDILNDADEQIVNLFRVLRDEHDELMKKLVLTPYSRRELLVAKNGLDEGDSVERARRMLVCMWQGRGAHEATTGWRYQRVSARNKVALADWTSLPRRLGEVVDRLRDIYLECDDALTILRRFDAPSTLHFVDPPYVAETRSKSSPRYRREFRRPREHRLLAATLRELEGMVVLSHPRCELYDALYATWEPCDRETIGLASNRFVETVWLNPACVAAQRQMSLELT